MSVWGSTRWFEMVMKYWSLTRQLRILIATRSIESASFVCTREDGGRETEGRHHTEEMTSTCGHVEENYLIILEQRAR